MRTLFLTICLGYPTGILAQYYNTEWNSSWQHKDPTDPPTNRPTKWPTRWPTNRPTPVPTPLPTFKPTPIPTYELTPEPTEESTSEIGIVGGNLFDAIANPSDEIVCPGFLDKSTIIDSSAILHYALVPANPPGSRNGLLCGRLEAENDGWIGLAVSETGNMIGSEAIIGLPGDDTVLKYEMNGKSQYGVTAMSESKQTLRNTSIDQEDGKTIMTFTKILVEDGEIPISEEGANIFLHARGGQSLGFHSNGHLSFSKDFAEDIDAASPIVEASTQIPAQACPEFFNKGIKIDSSATLRYAIVPPNPPGSGNGLLCGRLEADNEGWIGLAISSTGQMIGSEAIIGVPEDETVLKYDMTGKSLGGVSAMPENKQTLKYTSILQEDGKTIMTFAKLLAEEGEIPILEEGANIFLHARGGSSLGFHSNGHVKFRKDFDEDRGNKDAVATPPNVDSVESGLAAKDCTSEFCDFELDDFSRLRYMLNIPEDATAADANGLSFASDAGACKGCTISMEIIHEGEAWVAIAFSDDGKMVGSEAVIGIPGDGSVLKYKLGAESTAGVQPMPQQTLLDTSIEVKDGQTTMKFTKILKETGEIEVTTGDNAFLWAHGSGTELGYHKTRKFVVLNLASGASEKISSPNRAAWLAHGAMAFLAWGVCVPFAVQSALLRKFLPKGPIWFKLHRAFNTIAYALFVLIFAIAVGTTGKEGGNHFKSGHARMGLVMLMLATIQVTGGAFRPHLPTPESGEEKTKLRKGWEVGHRLIGIVLLACAFWQMGKGIELYAIKYSLSESYENKVAGAYWLWVGVMTAVIVIGGGYIRYRKSSAKKQIDEDDVNGKDGTRANDDFEIVDV